LIAIVLAQRRADCVQGPIERSDVVPPFAEGGQGIA